MIYRRKIRGPDGKPLLDRKGKPVRSPIWSYDFQVGGKHYHGSTKETSKQRAEDLEGKLKAAARSGSLVVVQDQTFGYLVKEYMRLHGATKKSPSFFDWTTRILLAHFGKERLLSSIAPKDVEEFMVWRRSKVKTATANRSLTVLKHMFKKAVEWRYAASNPAAKFRCEKERNRREHVLTVEEAEALEAQLPDWLQPFVLAALHTGARRGELLGLTWANVDLDRKLVRFVNTKNGEDRTVPLSATLAATLKRLPLRLKGGAVFRDPAGEPLTYNGYRGSFEGTAKRAGLTGFVFHDLRHSAASFMVQAGVPLNTVRAILGHKSLDMTLRYAHLAEGDLQRAVGVFDHLEGAEKSGGISGGTAVRN